MDRYDFDNHRDIDWIISWLITYLCEFMKLIIIILCYKIYMMAVLEWPIIEVGEVEVSKDPTKQGTYFIESYRLISTQLVTKIF